MRPRLWLTMSLLIPWVGGRSTPELARPRERESHREGAGVSRRPEIRCLLTPFAYRECGWMLAEEGGLLRGELLKVRSAWNGGELEVVCSGGQRGMWGNELRLTFRLADPTKPEVCAEFSWFSDVGPENASLDELRGDVFVALADDSGDRWARVRQGWDGRTEAQVAFELHGRHRGDPVCIHGVIDLDPPAAPEGR